MDRREVVQNKPLWAKDWVSFVENNSYSNTVVNELSSAAKSMFAFDIPQAGNICLKINDFFTPGWNGEGLYSKPTLHIENLIFDLVNDVQKQFRQIHTFNKSLKLNIYNEFIHFAHLIEFHSPEIDSYITFWHVFFENKKSLSTEYKETIDLFFHFYSLKIALIFILKLRFMAQINSYSKEVQVGKDLLNPNSWFIQLFQKSSNREFNCESFELNHYSWYRPSSSLLDSTKKVFKNLSSLNLIDITKFVQLDKLFNKETTVHNLFSQFKIANTENTSSHPLWGAFVNLLCLDLPAWLCPKTNKNNFQENISCKVTGDQIEDLAMSVLTSYYRNEKCTSSSILNLEVESDGNFSNKFLKYCLELDYLNTLAKIANSHATPPVDFICKSIKDIKQEANLFQTQFNLFNDLQVHQNKKFKRIILNLNQFPKNNPHFYLLNKIQNEINSLHNSGLMVVLSAKKLFVPSQSDKVDSLLEKLTLEATFTLDHLKGRGSLVGYIYIFSKKLSSTASMPSSINHFITTSSQSSLYAKNPCLSFRLSGELITFEHFHEFTEGLKNIIKIKNPDNISLYQMDLRHNLLLESFKDAIVNGKLINSTSKDPSKITHPQFFKNLMQTCVPLDQFFTFESITPEFEMQKHSKDYFFSSELLGIRTNRDEKYNLVLIVDFRDKEQIRLEFISAEAYRAQAEEYGHALCYYFGLIPKIKNINLNIFREYFKGHLGLQILQISLSGGTSKLKSKLSSILVPKFFYSSDKLPAHIEQTLELFTYNSDHILKFHPDKISDQYKKITPFISELSKKYPSSLLNLLTHFNRTLINMLDHISFNGKINFANPVFLNCLVKAKTKNIFPNNPNVYVDFKISNRADIHLPLTGVKFYPKTDMNDTAKIQLFSENKLILELHSDDKLLSFIKFILDKANTLPISKILQSVKVPELNEFTEIFVNHEQLMKSLDKIQKNIEAHISQIFNQSILTVP